MVEKSSARVAPLRGHSAPRRGAGVVSRVALPLGLIVVGVLGVVLALQQATLTRTMRNLGNRIVALEDRLVSVSRGASASTNSGLANLPVTPTPIDQLVGDDAVLGSPDAPVTIVEFSDFECPFCKRFFEQTLPELKARYIDTGRVRFVFRDFPVPQFHPNASKAAEAAECARDQGRFWEMHDLLFQRGLGGGIATLKGYAAELGRDSAGFAACLDSGSKAEEISEDRDAGVAAGVRATPGFVVAPASGSGVVFAGAHPLSVFEQIIEAALRS